MRYKLLGKSGLRVSELCLGTMTFGPEWGWGGDKDESKKIFDAFVKAGGNFVDTANRYTEGTSERYVGEFIANDRERFVLATKYTLFTQKGDPNACGNHRKNMVQAVNASLKRLNTDYIDLYWLHAWDYTTPVEEVMRGLDDLVSAGKIHYIGISDTPAWIVAQCNTLAELRGWSRFVALQIEYSLIARTPERELLPMAKAFDMAVTPWGIIGGGVLSGKYRRQSNEPHRLKEGSARLGEQCLTIGDEVCKIADEIGATPSRVAINWLRAQKSAQIIPILGARSLAQIEDNLGCLNFNLNDDQLKRLDEISKIELGFPHDFLRAPYLLDIVYAGMQDRLDNHRR